MDVRKTYFNIIIFCLVEAVLYMLFFNTNGVYFYVGEQNRDPGGDFYLALYLSKNLDPYYNNVALAMHPPFVILISYFLSLFDRSDIIVNINNLNLQNNTLDIFDQSFVYKNIFYILSGILLILLFYFIYFCIKNVENKEYKKVIYSILLLANSGFLCGLVRGNMVIFALLFILIYVIFYDSNSEKLKIISFFSLGIAFNIKPYLAVFGVLLLYDKKYKDCIKLCIISFFMFIIPFFFLKGGFLYNFIGFFKTLVNFSDESNFFMFGGRSIPLLAVQVINNILGTSFKSEIISFIFSILVSTVLFIKGFFIKDKWKKILISVLLMILLSINYGYIISFMTVPILFFLLKQEKITFINLLYMTSFLFLTAPFVSTFKYFSGARDILCNLFLLFLTFLILIDGLKINKANIKN